MTRHKRHRPALRSLYQWHRQLGLAVALLAVVLALTGVMLNHTERLRLDQRQIQQRWLLQWYGITPAEGTFFRADDRWLSQWGERLYLDGERLSYGSEQPLLGVVRQPQMLIAATENELLLFTDEGQLIERLDSLSGVPDVITGIAPGADGQVKLRTPNGTLSAVPESGQWHPYSGATAWSKSEAPPEALYQQLAQQHPGPALPLERVILDLHSGRILGKQGSYAMDAAAVLLLFNAASGVWIWWRRRRHQQQRRRQGL